MFISIYANQTTFILYIFYFNIVSRLARYLRGGVNYQNFEDIYRKRNKNYE